MKLLWRRILILAIAFLTLLSIYFIDLNVRNFSKKFVVDIQTAPEVDAIIVPGAYVFPSGKVSDILADRLSVAVELYKTNRAKKLLVSGDHGKITYDEVNAMRKYIQSKGVPRQDIFMDHAGFSTYESLYRTRDIFKVRKAIVVTQNYHLSRAIYIARKLGMEAYGVSSDKHEYYKIQLYKAREIAARLKDYFLVNLLHSKPKYLGEAIPISGDGSLTDDGK